VVAVEVSFRTLQEQFPVTDLCQQVIADPSMVAIIPCQLKTNKGTYGWKIVTNSNIVFSSALVQSMATSTAPAPRVMNSTA
jgi:hypothetical protein